MNKMIDVTVDQLAILGYVMRLDDAGIRATRDHLVRFMAQVLERTGEPCNLSNALNRLVKRHYLVRPEVGCYQLTAEGRDAHFKALEVLGVRNV